VPIADLSGHARDLRSVFVCRQGQVQIMRVLFLTSSAEVYGSERALLDLARDLTAIGEECLVVFPEEGPARKLFAAAGVPNCVAPHAILRRPLSQALLAAVKGLRSSATLTLLAREFDPDIIHSNTTHCVEGPSLARSLGVPHAWHLREIERWPTLAVRTFSALVASTGTVLSISRSAAVAAFGQSLRRRLGRSVLIVPDALDVERFAFQLPSDRRREAAQRRIVLPGRLTEWKGGLLAIEAARGAGVGAELELIGSAVTDQDEQWVRQTLGPAAAGVGVAISAPETDPARIYDGREVLIQASIRAEPFGRTVLEAMASGVTVVAPDQGGPAEVVEHGQTGFVYAAGDPQALSSTLRGLTDFSLEELDTIALRAYDVVRSLYAQRKATETVQRIYSELIEAAAT